MAYSAKPPISARNIDNATRSQAYKQRALIKLAGHPDTPRRPLTGYEYQYEVASDGALYSIRLKRFLKPVYNNEKQAAEIEFEFNGSTIRLSPGKAVALSFFSPIQRERIAAEAHDIQAFKTFHDVRGHSSIQELAYKYDVSEGAIFYILLASVAKTFQPGNQKDNVHNDEHLNDSPATHRQNRGYRREGN